MSTLHFAAAVYSGMLFTSAVTAADAFYTLAALDAEASNGTPFVVSDVDNTGRSQELLRTNSVTAIGPVGNRSSLTSVANLAAGSLAIWGGSNNALDLGSGFYFGADATGIVEFKETITYVLPAGSYADPLQIAIDTVVEGRIETSSPETIDGFVNGLVRWDMILFNTNGGPNTVYSNNSGFASHGDDLTILDPITLTAELVPGGTTLATDTAYDFELTASLWVIRNESFNPTTPNSTNIDFANSLRFLSVEAPLGLEYTSASGVFLSAIPVPPPVLLLIVPSVLLVMRKRAA